jgi:hypothetical protein
MAENRTAKEKSDAEGSEFIQNLLQIAVFLAVKEHLLCLCCSLSLSGPIGPGPELPSTIFLRQLACPLPVPGAFVIRALFRATEGKIKFTALGFRFEGASGPIVM